MQNEIDDDVELKLSVGSRFAGLSQISAAAGTRKTQWQRVGDGVKSSKKILRCNCQACHYAVVVSRKQAEVWEVTEDSCLQHALTCTAGMEVTPESAAQFQSVQEAFFEKNATQERVMERIKLETGFDAPPYFVTRAKEIVADKVEKETVKDMARLLPFLEESAHLSPDMYAVVELESKTGQYYECRFGRARGAPRTNVELLLPRSVITLQTVYSTYKKQVEGCRVKRVLIVWEWSRVLLDLIPPVLGLDAAHAKLGGTFISQLSGRFAKMYCPLATQWHGEENAYSHAFMLWHAMTALDLLQTKQWALISDRCKGLRKAFVVVVQAVNPSAFPLYDKPHLWRNIIHKFPELLKLDSPQGGPRTSLQLVQAVLYAKTPQAFSDALCALDEAYGSVAKASAASQGKKAQPLPKPAAASAATGVPAVASAATHKQAAHVVEALATGVQAAPREPAIVAGAPAALSAPAATHGSATPGGYTAMASVVARGSSAAFGSVTSRSGPANVDDNLEMDDELHAASVADSSNNLASGSWRIPFYPPRRVEISNTSEATSNLPDTPSDYIATFDQACFLVYCMPGRDYGISSSNSTEAAGSYLLRNGARNCNIPQSIIKVKETTVRYFANALAAVEKAHGAKERVYPCWPGSELDEHNNVYADDYKATAIAIRLRYKVWRARNGDHPIEHYVTMPTVEEIAAARNKTPFVAPLQPSTRWTRPTSGWSCDGNCLVPQNIGILCCHAKAVARAAFSTNKDDEEIAVELGYARYYHVALLREALRVAVSCELLHLSNVAVGLELLPIADMPKLVVAWDPENGGRPMDSRKPGEGEAAASSKRARAMTAETAAGPPRKNMCQLCKGLGHNRRTCPQRSRVIDDGMQIDGDDDES
jgi:hypothetical protein